MMYLPLGCHPRARPREVSYHVYNIFEDELTCEYIGCSRYYTAYYKFRLIITCVYYDDI